MEIGAKTEKFVETRALSLLQSMVAKLVKKGSLTLIDAAGKEREHGDGGDPRVTIRLHDPALYSKLFLNPELVAGEAYMDGTLTCETGDIGDLLAIFHINKGHLRGRPLRRMLKRVIQSPRRLQQHNPIARARQNVAHHYDLSNDFYKLFLDEDMNYSCAYFETPDQSLEEAQRAKQRHIASKLNIKPGMRVLDIGCGWGGMALYLAKHFDVHVTGVTLSTEQHAKATERAIALGVSDRVDFRLSDYREVTETFHRIVSIGMFEHVGVPHYQQFFDKVYDLLTPDGVMLLHAIGRRGQPSLTGPWIRKYIFPGGYSPSLSEVTPPIENAGLWASDIEIVRLHYAQTLRAWNERFQARRDDVETMFDERFCRMWEFYLLTSEFAFRHGGHMVFQIQLTKTPDAVPITRDYMLENEAVLRSVDAQ